MGKKLTQKYVDGLKPGDKAYEVMDPEIRGFVLRVMPTGTKTYYARYRTQDGRRYRVKIGRPETLSADDARTEAKSILGDVAKGKNPAEDRKRKPSLTLRVFLKKEYEPWAKLNLKSSEQTCRRIRSSFSRLLDKPIGGFAPFLVDKWRLERQKEKKSVATINRDIATLKAALTKAVEWGFIPTNPLRTVRLAREDHLRRVRYLSPAEEEALLSALDGREELLRVKRKKYNKWRQERGYRLYPSLDGLPFADYLKPMVILSMHTGLRRGELFNLKWSDIDFARRNLTIDGFKAKSGRTRHIPLNEDAMDTLRKWRDQTGAEGLVFSSKKGKRFDNIQKAWTAVLEKAKITDFRWHDLRHDFASRLVMNGVDLNTVRELLGHSDIKMTLRYAHLAPEHKAKAVALLTIPRTTEDSTEEDEDAVCA